MAATAPSAGRGAVDVRLDCMYIFIFELICSSRTLSTLVSVSFSSVVFWILLLLNVLLGFVLLLDLGTVCLYNIVGGLVRGFLLCPMSFLLTIVQSAELETVLRLQTD